MTLTDTRPTPQAESLYRVHEFRAAPSDDGLTLDGYAAVFGVETLIDSWEGSFREVIAPGAFKRTLGQRTPVLQFDHGQHPLIGSIPIGVIRSIREDARGLKVRGRLSDNWLIEPVRDAIRDGAITGMSFRFRVVRESWIEDLRTIEEVELFEVGPVVWPAYEATSVGVRSRDAAAVLADPDARREVARLLFSGTDLRSLADDDAPPAGHASPPDAPDARHAEDTPNRRDHRARLALAFADLT